MEDFKTVEKSLDKTNRNIADANNQLSVALQNDSALSAIKHKADGIVSYIETVKDRIKQVAGSNDSDEAMMNLAASNKVMFGEKKVDTIFSLLKNFQSLALLKCKDDSLKANVSLIFEYLKDAKKQAALFFKDTPAVGALTMLSKLGNDVKNAENIVLTYYVRKNTNNEF